MGKVNYDGITFDSDLEVEYYKYLQELKAKCEVLNFYYHPDAIQNLVGKRSYTPDFLVAYQDRIEIVECKGYNPYSKMIDDQIHNVMLSKTEYFLKSYICDAKARHIQFFCSKEWDTEKNSEKPDSVTAGSSRKFWWKCSKGHNWKATVVGRMSG